MPRQAIQRKLRVTYRWAKLRKRYREQNPNCEDLLKIRRGVLASAESVHHITPVVVAPLLAFDEENLAALCRSCHDAIEKLNKQGKKTFHLFTTTRQLYKEKSDG